MNARTLRGVAVLALACFALPRAEAGTITFGPLHTTTFFDVVLDATTPPYSATEGFYGAQLGWEIRGSIGWNDGSIIISTPLGFSMTYISCELRWPESMIGYPQTGFRWNLWNGAFPELNTLAPHVVRITWDISSAVPDSGSALAMFSAAFGALFLAHRRRETPRPRALRGV